VQPKNNKIERPFVVNPTELFLMDIPTAARLLSTTVFAVGKIVPLDELVYVAIGHKWLLSPDAVRAFISQPGAKDIASSGSMSTLNSPRMVTKVFCFVVENLIFRQANHWLSNYSCTLFGGFRVRKALDLPTSYDDPKIGVCKLYNTQWL
jgi:hypothetical protein